MSSVLRRHDCYCKAKGCKTSTSESNVSFFRFPKDADHCASWVAWSRNEDLLQLDSAQLRVSARLCSRHFSRDQFTNDLMNRLIRGAHPSIHPSQPDPPAHDAATPTTMSDHANNVSETLYFFPEAETEVEVLSSNDLENEPCTSNVSFSSSVRSHKPIASSTPKRPLEDIDNDINSTPKRTRMIADASPETSQPTVTTPTMTPVRLFTSKSLSPGRKCAMKLLMKSKSKRCILKVVNASRISDLSPRKKKMHAMIMKANKRLGVLERRCNEMKLGLRDMQSNLTSTFIQQLEQDVSPVAARLFKSQIRCGKKSSRGRRYTIEDKILAISLYKRSPKAYKLMQTFLALPAPRTLITVLNQIPFLPGINGQTFQHLKEMVSKMDVSDRVCSLIFDEVALSSSIYYSEKLDQIVGFEDFGSQGRTSSLANHALVFMARGLRRKWKQPIAYYFCKDCTKTNVLHKLIYEVIVALQETGLHVLCTICDQGPTNRTALDYLVNNNPSRLQVPDHAKFFRINEDDIAVIYDPPHLLKSLRNAFMKYNVVWSCSDPTGADDNINIQARASWDHIKLFFRKDKQTIYQRAPKLTEAHIDPTSNQKMRVNLAAQVFSQRVASGVNSMIADPSLFGQTDSTQHYMPSSAVYTSQFLSDIDQLFDSFNGTQVRPQELKMHRVCLTKNSIHKTFWPNMIEKVNSWRFVDNKGKIHRSPFQNGWLTTIHGSMQVGQILRDKYAIKVLQTRRLNQDPLENLFCLIRQHGQDNTNPSCSQFESALKTCIINGMMRAPSSGSNCVADTDDLLTNLKSFLQPDEFSLKAVNSTSMISDDSDGTNQPQQCNEDDPVSLVSGDGEEREPFGTDDDVNDENGQVEFNLDDFDFSEVMLELRNSGEVHSTLPDYERSTVAYVSGYIIRKIVIACECCRTLLTTTDLTGDHILIDFRERSDKWKCLIYPTPQFVTYIGLASQLAINVLGKSSHEQHIKQRITHSILNSVDFSWFKCSEHRTELLEQILKLLCRVLIHHHCRKSNREYKATKRNIGSGPTNCADKATSRQKRMKKVLHK